MRSMMLGIGIFCVGLATAQAQTFHVTDHWKIGGEGGWDYLLNDEAAQRLYVTHGPKVEVIDTTSGKLIGAVTGLKGTHGVTLDPDGKTGYISDGAANSVVVFDRSTLAVSRVIPVGTNPDGIIYEPATKTVWAFNGRSKDVSVVDPVANKVVATIQLPGKPEFPRVDGSGTVFVNIEDKNSIVKLDAKQKRISGGWALTGCDSPSGMAIDLKQHRLFSVCDGGKMAVSDFAAGRISGLASIGDSPDAAGFDAERNLAFSSNGGGTLTILDAGKAGIPVLQTVTTAKGARTMAYDGRTGRVFLSVAKFGPLPAATATMPHPRPSALPDSFEILVVSR